MTNIIPLQTARAAPATQPELFVRIGEAHYSQLAHLYAEGKFRPRRVIFDASRLKHTSDFAKALHGDGVELTLDTKAAELGAVAKYAGWASSAPWSNGTLHLPGQFDASRRRAFVELIAEEAVARRFDRVLAPSHYLKGGFADPWFDVDIRLCVELREALNRAGGGHIAIDYPVIIQRSLLCDERAALTSRLADLPFENLVLRTSHFGADATAPMIRAIINTLDLLHNFGHPIIVDHVGGIIGRALLAFGTASAIAHGVDEHSRFNASTWDTPAKERDDDEEKSGGRIKRIALANWDKGLTEAELTALARARGGQSLVVCQDRNCCRSLADMIQHSRRHSIIQEQRAMSALEATPDLMRADHFLDKEVAALDRASRQIKELKPVMGELKPIKNQTLEEAAESLIKRLANHAVRNEKVRATLENIHQLRGREAPRAAPAHLSSRITSVPRSA